MNALLIFLLSFTMSAPQTMVPVESTCPGWGSGQDSLNNIKNHVIYRDYMRSDDFENAFPFWEKVYEAAPAATVKHFNDGIRIYKAFYENETDSLKKEEYAQQVMKIYDDRISCLGKEGFVLGRKSFEMFYGLDRPYEDAYPIGKRSIDLQGLKSESSALYPVAFMAVELFKRDTTIVSRDEAVELYETFQGIVTHNLVSQKKEKSRVNYQKAWDAIEAKFAEVSLLLFDCQYFEARERPMLDSVWNSPDDMKAMVQRLAQGGCDENAALVEKLVERRKVVLDSTRTANMLPMDWLEDYLRDKNLEMAHETYPEAEKTATNMDRLYEYTMILATSAYSVERNKSKARTYARKAIQLNPNSAEAYYLIGEMYASSGSDCGSGTGWNSQVVVWPAIDKWNQAIKADPNSKAAGKARKQIAQYTQYMPSVEQIFQRNLREGNTYTVPCWIQEKTKIRAYNPF